MAFPTADMSSIGPLDMGLQPFTMPTQPQTGGMFGGGGPSLQNALMAAAAGYMARRNPGQAQSMMGILQEKQSLNRQAQLAMLRDNLEFQRQLKLLPIEAQLKLQYPTDDFSQGLYQSGERPGTPGWTSAQAQHTAIANNPVVMTPYGPMRYSDVAAGQAAGAPAPSNVTFTPVQGGPTPPASGNFLGSGRPGY